jgi:hypothetical protein
LELSWVSKSSSNFIGPDKHRNFNEKVLDHSWAGGTSEALTFFKEISTFCARFVQKQKKGLPKLSRLLKPEATSAILSFHASAM